jgi:hypothetical protein
MDKFRELGFIDYNGSIEVHISLVKPRKIEVQLGTGQLSGDKTKTIEHSKVA